ncbi:myosin-binding protein 1-like isoform X2 [Chenopodium quinoa]|uniref:GTD-binding domain-containing protein n=1 Tax=Chenopodium quinoa TaxID=63459 RepID=A0A803LFG0_CHEQI|nr:myosin-binding protein 1-like isoform X2 [Chenopodium quinoa]
MAVKGSFPIKVDSNVHGFARVLKSAACEWLLLFLLLLDAAFLYFLKKFAQYCELQLPCILCSRLDHILGKENPDFYVNLLCNNHKSEISSLVSCHNHGKLVDVHGMCEECLFSFAKNDSREEAYKILVGKLGSECIQKPLVNLDINSGSLTTKFCSCCSKPWRSRPNVQKMVQSKLPSALVSNPEIPPPKSPGHRCLNSQQGLKNRRDRFSLPTKPLVLGSKDHDSLSHVGYTEVKISSDSDSDFPFSDDDDLINVPRNRKINEFLSRQGSKFTPKSQYADVFPAVQRQKSTPATSNLMFSHLEPEKGETTTPRFISNGDLRKGLGELNWQQLIKKASPLAPELVSLDDIPLSSSAPKDLPAISADEGDRVSLSNTLDASGYTDFISHKTALSSENVQLPARLSKENCIETKEMGDTGLTSAINHWESIDLNSTSTLSSRKDAAFVPNNNSVIGARDLAPIIIKDVKASNLLSEEIGSSTCNGNESAEKPSVSKVSDTQTDSSSSNICPPVNGHFDEPRMIQNPSSNDTLMPPKSPGMERSQSLESLEESVSEIEGESLVDKLRRQVEYDKKCIKNLHKELDEERNASAIAANQAMAMITKLQEEKAALNMEALQYLRMMEEQAEYDVDALEKANEMIAEKEKEIQELEAELDYFRIKYPEDFPEMI